MEKRLECIDLTVAYGNHVAADHISFDVSEGEIFGLLGPNGAGKTSIIRALTTIIEPTSGRAVIAGVDLGDHDEVRRRIGVLPESSGYPRSETGLQYLQFFGEVFGMTKSDARQRAKGLLDQLGLGDTPQRISEYSRGMRQRLGLCRALVNDPEVLFLDEPTLGLDPAGKEDIMHYLGATAERGTSVVLCTHLLDEVERICDRVAIMNKGRLVAQGSVAQVISSARIEGSLNEAFLALTADEAVA